MTRAAAILGALALGGCAFVRAHPAVGERLGLTAAIPENPVGRLYPDPLPTWVELVGVDGERVWRRVHEVLAEYGVEIRREHVRGLEGTVECKPFSIDLPGVVNLVDYAPGEIVVAPGAEVVKVSHELRVNVSAHASGLVRVWIDGPVRVGTHAIEAVRAPPIAAHRLLEEIARPLGVVAEWRLERPGGAVAKGRGAGASVAR